MRNAYKWVLKEVLRLRMRYTFAKIPLTPFSRGNASFPLEKGVRGIFDGFSHRIPRLENIPLSASSLPLKAKGAILPFLKEFKGILADLLRTLLLLVLTSCFLGEVTYALPEETATLVQSPAIGARVVGMGGAFTAVADDAHAILSNPAGLCQVANVQISGGYFRPYLVGNDIKNGFLGFVNPFTIRGAFAAVGVGYSSLSGPFYSERTGILCFSAAAFRNKAMFGAGLKSFRAGLDPVSEIIAEDPEFDASDPLFNSEGSPGMSTAAFDIGVLCEPISSLKLGMAIENAVSQKKRFQETEEPVALPRCYRIGAAYTRSLWQLTAKDVAREQGTLTGIVEISHNAINSSRTDFHVGGEAWLRPLESDDIEYAVRTGLIIQNKHNPKFTCGLGIRNTYSDNFGVQIDYAFSWHPSDDLIENRVSVSLVLLPDSP
jgi:hypothetical protein